MYLFWICHFRCTILMTHGEKKLKTHWQRLQIICDRITRENWPHQTFITSIYVFLQRQKRAFITNFATRFLRQFSMIKRQKSPWEIFAKWTLKTVNKVNKCLWICFYVSWRERRKKRRFRNVQVCLRNMVWQCHVINTKSNAAKETPDIAKSLEQQKMSQLN